MNKISKSRKLFDEDSYEIYNKITTNKNFKNNSSILEIFSLAMAIGKRKGIRQSLDKTRKGEVNKYTMDNSKSFNYLLMAIGVEEKDSMNILTDEIAYFQIAEEYAKNGIELLDQDILNKKNNILDDMEMELIKFYDSKFNSKSSI